jgi:hypothetical protein
MLEFNSGSKCFNKFDTCLAFAACNWLKDIPSSDDRKHFMVMNDI